MTPDETRILREHAEAGYVLIPHPAKYVCVSGHVVTFDQGIKLPGSLSIGSHGYAQFCKEGRMDVFHRWIMGCVPGDGKIVDHINRDKLDCRRANLRIVTRFENTQNRKPGRNIRRADGHWQAYANKDKHQINLGRYDTEEEALAAVAAWRQKNWTCAP